MAAADGRPLWRRLEHGCVQAWEVLLTKGSLETEQECAGADILSERLWRDHTGGVSARWTVVDVELTGCRGEAAQLGKGTTHLVKYKMVERWINLGWAEIL